MKYKTKVQRARTQYLNTRPPELLFGKSGAVPISFALLVALFFGAQFFSAQAQAQPRLFITWSAESYAPPGFNGKVLPTAGSPITVSFEVIDGGRPANVSGQTTYWYLNNDLIENRPGTKTVRFNAPARAPSVATVRIELPAYPGGLLIGTARIPVVRPEAVIEAPYPGRVFSGPQIRALGTPYFFNADDPSGLVVAWTVNGQSPPGAERPRELAVNLDPASLLEATVNIVLSITNAARGSESASQFIILRPAQ